MLYGEFFFHVLFTEIHFSQPQTKTAFVDFFQIQVRPLLVESCEPLPCDLLPFCSLLTSAV